ncbi:hypothetical protein LguiA_005103 [Lonicera macranthoides]
MARNSSMEVRKNDLYTTLGGLAMENGYGVWGWLRLRLGQRIGPGWAQRASAQRKKIIIRKRVHGQRGTRSSQLAKKATMYGLGIKARLLQDNDPKHFCIKQLFTLLNGSTEFNSDPYHSGTSGDWLGGEWCGGVGNENGWLRIGRVGGNQYVCPFHVDRVELRGARREQRVVVLVDVFGIYFSQVHEKILPNMMPHYCEFKSGGQALEASLIAKASAINAEETLTTELKVNICLLYMGYMVIDGFTRPEIDSYSCWLWVPYSKPIGSSSHSSRWIILVQDGHFVISFNKDKWFFTDGQVQIQKLTQLSRTKYIGLYSALKKQVTYILLDCERPNQSGIVTRRDFSYLPGDNNKNKRENIIQQRRPPTDISFPLRNIFGGLTLEGGTPGAKIRSETLAEINVVTDASGEGFKDYKISERMRRFGVETLARSYRLEPMGVLAYL